MAYRVYSSPSQPHLTTCGIVQAFGCLSGNISTMLAISNTWAR